MNVLAFDTCLGAVSVAVRGRTAPGELLAHHAFELRDRGQAERLLPMTAEVMDAAGLAFRDLHRIAVTVGPGSFTGVRVGVAAARALALASGVAVVGATSLEVMACQAFELLSASRRQRPIVVAADARRGMVYLQRFEAPHGASGQPRLLALEDVGPQVGRQSVIAVGSGALAVAAAVGAAGGDAEAALPDLQPDARALAVLAPDLAPADRLRPVYLRLPDAKPQGDNSLPRAAP
jgi:tRNA threonylcarbamoyladenosine biosynthesis protein TsaB